MSVTSRLYAPPSYGVAYMRRRSTATFIPKAKRPVRECTRLLAAKDSLELEAELFLKSLADIESGKTMEEKPVTDTVFGDDIISDKMAEEYCSDILSIVDRLKKTRDMTLNEIKLTVAIDDPQSRERRRYGFENKSGVSRDDLAEALIEVSNGMIPKDRLTLKVLREEMISWPGLDEGDSKATSGKALDKLDVVGGLDAVKEEGVKAVDKGLPDWVGYSYLYIISSIPLFIGIIVISILFFNSLK